MRQLGQSIMQRLGIVVATLAVLYLVVTLPEPIRSNWGDPWTDCNVQTTGRFFAKYGFAKLAFVPVIDVEPLTEDSLRYTHYPPLPDILNGVQQRLFGLHDISSFRVLAIAMSILALFLFYRYVRSIWGDLTASISLALLSGNFLWLQYADTAHHIPYYTASGFGALLCASRFVEHRKPRDAFLVGVLTFVCYFASYDFIFFVPLMIAATALLRGERILSRPFITLFLVTSAGALAGIALKYVLVILAVGWPRFYEDLIFQFHERATARYGGDYKAGYALIFFHRLLRFFTPVFFLVVAAQLASLVARLVAPARAKSLPLPRWTPLVVLLAGVPFAAVFSQLFCEQFHPTLVLLPGFAIGLGALVADLWKSPRARALCVAVTVFALGWQVKELLSFKKTYLVREDYARVRALLDERDHQNFLFSSAPVGASFVSFWNRYEEGIGFIPPEALHRYFDQSIAEFGGEPVRYVEFKNLDDALDDKFVFGVFRGAKKWDWIAEPTRYRDQWKPVFREKDRRFQAGIAASGTLELETPTMNVWRFDRERLRELSEATVMAQPTTEIDFGDARSDTYKVDGLRYSEHYAGAQGFAWSERKQLSRIVFTLQGLVRRPIAPPTDAAAVRLNLPPGRAYRLEVSVVSGTPTQHVDWSLNGKPVLSSDFAAGAPVDVVIDVPSSLLTSAGVQTLRFAWTTTNENGLGVALRTLRVVPR